MGEENEVNQLKSSLLGTGNTEDESFFMIWTKMRSFFEDPINHELPTQQEEGRVFNIQNYDEIEIDNNVSVAKKENKTMDGGDGSEKELKFFLYISPTVQDVMDREKAQLAYAMAVEQLIRSTNPTGQWRVTRTSCGMLASFTSEATCNEIMSSGLEEILGCPTQVAKFSSQDYRQKQVLMLRDVPRAIPIQEIKHCLENQGIVPVSIERSRGNIRIELVDPLQYDLLLRQGLDFLGVTRFLAVPDRWKMPMAPRPPVLLEKSIQDQMIIQCYRCQGFWHIAANCRERVRCVRCGDEHSVENCTRPRNDPICCHCAGPHHAAYKLCPARLQLVSPSFLFPAPFLAPS